jgi:hypothetical protein
MGVMNLVMSAKILLQTTILEAVDDWNVGRFSKLAATLAQEHSVTTRNLERTGGVDQTLANLKDSDFDQVWILGVDGGNGLNSEEIAGISRYWAAGRGLLIARDHNDMGACLLDVGLIGQAHYFHTKNQDPDESRRCQDDKATQSILWPNYHTGHNGDFQTVEVLKPRHPLMWNATAGRTIREFPAHPHEGSVGVPPGCGVSELLVRGTSLASGAKFGQVVTFEHCEDHGRGVAQSSFHHFADFNWDPRLGCPSFVTEKSGSQVLENPERLDDVRAYILNLGRWLSNSL